MRLPLATLLRLAWRNLWRNYRRTLIMLLAIAVGVWAMIAMSAFLRGMTDQMVRSGLNTLPGEVQIHQSNYRADPSVVNSMPPPDGDLLDALNQPPITAWTSRVRVPAMVSSEYDSRGVILLGVDPEGETAIGALPDTIVEGRFLSDADDRGVVLGQRLVERLDTALGKRVVLMSQDPDNNVADRGARVVGIYRARLRSTEDTLVYAARNPTQSMLKLGSKVSEVAVIGGDYRHSALYGGDLPGAVFWTGEHISDGGV